MNITTQIYGTSKSTSPDIVASFTVAEHFTCGKWTFNICNFKYTFNNELIDELSEEHVIEEMQKFIEMILNSPNARNWIASPTLRMYYDDEEKNVVFMRTR